MYQGRGRAGCAINYTVSARELGRKCTGFGDLLSFAALAQYKSEGDCLRGHGGHCVAEAKTEHASFVGDKSETPLSLLLHAVNGPVIGPNNLHTTSIELLSGYALVAAAVGSSVQIMQFKLEVGCDRGILGLSTLASMSRKPPVET